MTLIVGANLLAGIYITEFNLSYNGKECLILNLNDQLSAILSVFKVWKDLKLVS